jgi:hypothetical protein
MGGGRWPIHAERYRRAMDCHARIWREREEMKCPHCLESFHEEWEWLGSEEDCDGSWGVWYTKCPDCDRVVMRLDHHREGEKVGESLIRPKATARASLPPDVPEAFAGDYREACLVLADSPKASAALSRRCLQNLLREQFKVKPSNLSDEIDEVLPELPSHLAGAVDGIRNLGNFAAHPMKSSNSGEILDVEPGEAEWCLDVLESLFDFCFVQPAVLAKKRQAVNQKLKEAGKPPMK